MNRVAFITLSSEGAALFPAIQSGIPGVRLYAHRALPPIAGAVCLDQIVQLTAELFHQSDAMIYAAPCGVVVRSLGALPSHKTTDPAVVVVDVLARWAISLLSGHEGGANELAIRIANLTGAEPITTTTEARKDVIAGIGCRRGTPSSAINDAVLKALDQSGASLNDVRLLASADVKANEPGLLEAARSLGLPLRIISSDEIRASTRAFTRSGFVQRNVGLPAVAEPCALLAGRRTHLFLPKSIFNQVTVALAREASMSSESDPEGGSIVRAGPNRPSPNPRLSLDITSTSA